jgi:hypothetical protein
MDGSNKMLMSNARLVETGLLWKGKRHTNAAELIPDRRKHRFFSEVHERGLHVQPIPCCKAQMASQYVAAKAG